MDGIKLSRTTETAYLWGLMQALHHAIARRARTVRLDVDELAGLGMHTGYQTIRQRVVDTLTALAASSPSAAARRAAQRALDDRAARPWMWPAIAAR